MRHVVVSETLKGIRRTLGTAQKGKLPLLTADLQKLLAHLPENLLGVRDQVLLRWWASPGRCAAPSWPR